MFCGTAVVAAIERGLGGGASRVSMNFRPTTPEEGEQVPPVPVCRARILSAELVPVCGALILSAEPVSVYGAQILSAKVQPVSMCGAQIPSSEVPPVPVCMARILSAKVQPVPVCGARIPSAEALLLSSRNLEREARHHAHNITVEANWSTSETFPQDLKRCEHGSPCLIILALGRLRQENYCEFQASLNYVVLDYHGLE